MMFFLCACVNVSYSLAVMMSASSLVYIYFFSFVSSFLLVFFSIPTAVLIIEMAMLAPAPALPSVSRLSCYGVDLFHSSVVLKRNFMLAPVRSNFGNGCIINSRHSCIVCCRNRSSWPLCVCLPFNISHLPMNLWKPMNFWLLRLELCG